MAKPNTLPLLMILYLHLRPLPVLVWEERSRRENVGAESSDEKKLDRGVLRQGNDLTSDV